MTTALIMQGIRVTPHLRARIAGIFYWGTLSMGVVVFLTHGSVRFAANLLASACYIAVAVLLYGLFKPVNKKLSLLAACCSLAGLAAGKLWPRSEAVEFVLIGLFCLLIGYLIFRSAFLPRILAALMAFAGPGLPDPFVTGTRERSVSLQTGPGGIGKYRHARGCSSWA